MLDGAPIAYWIGFHAVVLVLIVLDLAVLGRGEASTQTRRNVVFFLFLAGPRRVLRRCGSGHCWEFGHQRGLEFASGYLIELSLSIDNLFVFLLMFPQLLRSQPRAAQGKRCCWDSSAPYVMRRGVRYAGIALLEAIRLDSNTSSERCWS